MKWLILAFAALQIFIVFGTVNAEQLRIIVTGAEFDGEVFSVFGTVENTGFGSTRGCGMFLVVWHGNSVLFKEPIYPGISENFSDHRPVMLILHPGAKVSWQKTVSIPQHVGSNFGWEIKTQKYSSEIHYPK